MAGRSRSTTRDRKTGCEIENLQFSSRQSLEPAIAVLSVVAVWLLQMRDAGRDEGLAGRPAEQVVPALWVRVLSAWRHRRACPDWTYGQFTQALRGWAVTRTARAITHPVGLSCGAARRNCKP